MITAVTCCKGRRRHLEMTLPFILEEFGSVIVVDWSCPENSGDFAQSLGARVIRQAGEKFWNASKAQNLGAQFVTSEYVCFIDADTLLFSGAGDATRSLINESTMVLSPSIDGAEEPNLGGFIAIDIEHFRSVGGYDERFYGWTCQDLMLRAKLRIELGLKAARLPAHCIGAIQHPNDMRKSFVKDPIEESFNAGYHTIIEYLADNGIKDWKTDPLTSDIAFKRASHNVF